jgi:CheY-like chemotaxis protein
MVKTKPSRDAARPCVLIIDDEESVRVALRTILQSDYDILEADSANHGLEVLEKKHPDLVTIDVRMAGQSGLDALKMIRESNEHHALPVILITGHPSLDGACEAFKLGATDYIQKPFGVEQVKTSVRNGLMRHEPVPANHAGNGKLAPGQKEPNRKDLARIGKASAAFVHDLASPLQVLTILNSVCSRKLSSVEASPHRDKEILDALGQMERLLAWSAELVKGWQTIAVPTERSCDLLDVQALLERVLDIVHPYATLNGVDLTRAPLPKKMEVYGDRVQLERALVNITLNGIKASTARARTVELGARFFQDFYVFRVTDSGPGFSHERMREVLGSDPFVSSGKARRGLGLFIADWIAVNHGGKLQIMCEKGLGTTVEFFVPATTPA